MKLAELYIESFRCYKEKVSIKFNEITGIIGRNDAGKSAILEALDIFFNSSKYDKDDLCKYSIGQSFIIGCKFEDFPDSITIDVNSTTSLAKEYLLNADNQLEIIKKFDCSSARGKVDILVNALHPNNPTCRDLLLLKNEQLKNKVRELQLPESPDDRSNVVLRRHIYSNTENINLTLQELPLNKEDAKAIWDRLQKILPIYQLFKADRPSSDEDSEVQDPMKSAISQAIQAVQDDIERIKDVVKTQVFQVATRTLVKLREIDEQLASELTPTFKSNPKWEGFTFSLTGDDQIPINKRGSGVRRLILLSFFRAEAERKLSNSDSTGIIYAIEEPETSQHPNNQIMLIEALKDLSEADNCQVIITTHVPGLAGMLPYDSVRYVKKTENNYREIINGGETTLLEIADSLGIIPDERVKVIVCVEGTNDISFLKRISKILRQMRTDIPDLENDPRITIIPLGGSTLKEWVNNHYLKNIGKREIHIYDRDTETPPRYQEAFDEVNARTDGSRAFMTVKRELENYLHPQAIQDVLGINISFTDIDDVPIKAAEAIHNLNSPIPWNSITHDKKCKKESMAKKRLNTTVVDKMTIDLLNLSDTTGEIIGWLTTINAML